MPPPAAGRIAHVGRVGALAVALGIGAAIACVPVVAHADQGDSTSPHSLQRATQASAGASARPARTPRRDTSAAGSSARRSARSAESDQPERPDRRHIDLTRPLRTLLTAARDKTPAEPDAPLSGAVLLAASTSTSARRPAKVGGSAETSPTVAATTSGQDVLVEAEAMTLSSAKNGAVYSDSTASGGRAVVLNKNSSISKTVTLPQSSSVVIRAKGDQYQGAPTMKVTVNGTEITTVAVSATSWTNYTVPLDAGPGTYTLTIAYINDLSGKKSGDRNLRVDSVRVVAATGTTPTPPSTSGAPFFGAADWLWKPIPANATIDSNSATWVSYLAAPGKSRIANLYQYAIKLITASQVTSTTPRYDVSFTQPWGSDPFGTNTVPIPTGTKIPPGSDGHLAILDPATGKAYGIWQAKYNSTTNTWSGSWGGMTSLTGNGVDTSGSATAAGIARYAGVVTGAEFSAAVAANTGINHALVFSTDIAGSPFVSPAVKSDGQNIAGVALPIPEGYRIQLDPSIDVDAIPGITAGEKVIAKTLQTYGAYVVDQGAARMAFAFELLDDATAGSPGSAYVDAGFAWDYYGMDNIPWSSLRVLAPTTVAV
ncbi:carbohydrate-binding domain-containing protein [Mycobacterium sp. C3-094]